MMAYVQYGHMTEAERAADERHREAMEMIKLISQHQAVIVGQLEQLVRGHPPDAIRKRIAEEAAEYGLLLEELMGSVDQYRLTGPKTPNRY
jgi:hypothetical protein